MRVSQESSSGTPNCDPSLRRENNLVRAPQATTRGQICSQLDNEVLASTSEDMCENMVTEKPQIDCRSLTPRFAKTLSLPVILTAYEFIDERNRDDGSSPCLLKQRLLKSMRRSHSLPLFDSDIRSARQSDSAGAFRIVTNASQGEGSEKAFGSSNNGTGENENDHCDNEHIPDEAALCRICLVELGEGSRTFKLECMCRGELALGHEDCVMQWFTLKGNRRCDVCKHDVQNLPVTIQCFEDHTARNSTFQAEAMPRLENGREQTRAAYQSSAGRDCIWLNFLFLALVNIMAYACFFELILLEKRDFPRIAITLPFSCISGFLAAVVATKVVDSKYVWIYTAIQFGFVVFFAYVFYLTFQIQPYVIAMFLGFGATLIGKLILGKAMERLRALMLQWYWG